MKIERDDKGKTRVAKGDKSKLGGQFAPDVDKLKKDSDAIKSVAAEIEKKHVPAPKPSSVGMYQGKPRKTAVVPETAYWNNFITKAKAEGFEVFEGPWGSTDKERSLVIEKRDEEMGGKFIIWCCERTENNLKGSPRWEREGETSERYWMDAWFEADTVEPYANPQHGLDLDFEEVDGKEVFDYDKLVASACTCNECGKRVSRSQLHTVGFAGKYCDDCYIDAKARIETPGWYN